MTSCPVLFRRYLQLISSLIRLHPCELAAYLAFARVSVQSLIGPGHSAVRLLGKIRPLSIVLA